MGKSTNTLKKENSEQNNGNSSNYWKVMSLRVDRLLPAQQTKSCCPPLWINPALLYRELGVPESHPWEAAVNWWGRNSVPGGNQVKNCVNIYKNSKGIS